MSVNLHTLDSDMLYEILVLCPNLKALSSLILTHPAVFNVFSSRRRLILRIVFKRQIFHENRGKSYVAPQADAVNKRVENIINPIDAVGLREALWPRVERILYSPTEHWTSKYATAMLASYHSADLQDEALEFAMRTMVVLLRTRPFFDDGPCAFAAAVSRTYMAAKMPDKAIELQETLFRRLVPRYPQHNRWAKQLVTAYAKTGHSDRVLPLQIKCWEEYSKVNGPRNEVTLYWAREAIREYKRQDQNQKAIEFHQRVRSTLDPKTDTYIAWSRQLIHMYQREKQHAAVLSVTEEVWRHMDPETTGYRAWMAQLGQIYVNMGRLEDSITVYEAAWEAIKQRLIEKPNDNHWKWEAKGAGRVLAKAYDRNQRQVDALTVLSELFSSIS
ncbi:hypothetical protein BCR34DRAFT_666068 [Clohesyomyces aquaticus]|uniref:Uncharacterized protein n=1 Tax=Clohesyomyces aquaticus TaxID=1231657 RepID=A0A1Y1ZE63_9PLEO|nr:hypothetical protein BCR34DRAFT_666068 [Clohesyomyces aquaticus]